MVEATDELRRQIAEMIADYHGRSIQAHTLFRSYELAGELLPLVAAVVAEARTEGAIAELEAAISDMTPGGAYADFSRAEATGDRVGQAYHEGVHDAWAAVNARLAAIREGGNQNAEPLIHIQTDRSK